MDHHRRVALLGGELVANRLRARPRLRLILPTGNTPLGMYASPRAHAADGSLSPREATLFQLDEYCRLRRIGAVPETALTVGLRTLSSARELLTPRTCCGGARTGRATARSSSSATGYRG